MGKLTKKQVFKDFQNKEVKKRTITKRKIYEEYTFNIKKEFEDFIDYVSLKIKKVKIAKVMKKKMFIRLENMSLKDSCRIYDYMKKHLIRDFKFSGEHFNYDLNGNITVNR